MMMTTNSTMRKVHVSSGFKGCLAKEAANPGTYTADAIKAWELAVNGEEIAASLVAATQARCNCGCTGDWSRSISGTSGMEKCVWSGCPNCSGTAVGYPVLLSDMKIWRKFDLSRKLQYLATAIANYTGSKAGYVMIDADSIDSTIDYEVA